jgi:stalled ribosome rescue protein Dom34
MVCVYIYTHTLHTCIWYIYHVIKETSFIITKSTRSIQKEDNQLKREEKNAQPKN